MSPNASQHPLSIFIMLEGDHHNKMETWNVPHGSIFVIFAGSAYHAAPLFPSSIGPVIGDRYSPQHKTLVVSG
uniref:Uncharacterized protein n=1 Tax=Physcomitrium patens TaxID=3218 RepID=A0A2K1JE61_PHYPA|nr:hypothetical protein PHYPA_020096 [Physcomitrium patens]